MIEDDGRKREKECLWVFLFFTNIVIVTLTVSHPRISAQLGWTDVTFVLINIPVILFYRYGAKDALFSPNGQIAALSVNVGYISSSCSTGDLSNFSYFANFYATETDHLISANPNIHDEQGES